MKGFMFCMLNCLPAVAGGVLYAGGASVLIPLFFLLNTLLLWMNFRCCKKTSHLVCHSCILLVSTLLGNSIAGYLYFSRICDDLPGRAIHLGLTLIACAFVVAASTTQILIKIIKQKGIRKRNQLHESSEYLAKE